jgi:uncharacterized integral membrane protein
MPSEEETSALAPIKQTDHLSTGAIVRLVIAGLVLIAIALFCARNTDSTNVDYLFGNHDAPLFVVIALSAVAGAVLMSLASWRHHRRHRA